MQRKSGRSDAGHDVEAVLDELYATPPPGFVGRREELASAARTAGHAEDARLIHAARRPTLAAWAANLLLRSQPEESRRFLELGRALREAYQTLDAEGVKELSAQRRRVVAALSRQAAQLARDAGHGLSDSAQQDVESTLLAVLADQDAADQWATGHLTSALTPPSTLPSGTTPTAKPSRRPPSRTTAPPPARTRAKDELADRRRRRQEELTRARKAAKAAEQRLRAERAAQADADALWQRARDRHDQARQQVSAAEQHLEQAREELRQADQAQQEAQERRQAAADALARAEQAAREAAHEVDRLAAPGRQGPS
ncbi:hypothetical protein OG252_05520 [Streptomyces sp. NBC_01352]|uniref:hypothetical protein n=1 Tax=unclassified Streptomyces TaxID=2593676 RepID=UPI002E34119F|nr:hypothetical protein [Streptomyces sp. NBC_01352]